MPTFSTPTYELSVGRIARSFRFKLTYADSVVRVNGVLVQVKTPSHRQLKAAGAEGVDYFIGGHVYNITDAVAAELTAANFTVIPDSGYGLGPYGSGSYGG